MTNNEPGVLTIRVKQLRPFYRRMIVFRIASVVAIVLNVHYLHSPAGAVNAVLLVLLSTAWGLAAWNVYRMRLAVKNRFITKMDAFVRLLEHGCCPNGHGLLKEIGDGVRHCAQCGFETNLPPQ